MTCLPSPQTPAPPVLGSARRNSALPVWLVGSGLALAFVAQWLQSGQWQWPWPSCLFRKLVGIPCLTCGCTRSLAAWTRLDLAAAMRFNPLFFALCVLLLAWLAAWCVERLTGRHLIEGWRERVQAWPLWRLLAVLAVLNWVYLILTLPK